MRNTLVLLSSLALAAAASAQSTATAACSTVLTYTAPASITVADVPGGIYAGRPNGQYDHNTPDFDNAGGTTTLTQTGSTSFNQTGNTFTILSNTAATLDSSNYAAVHSQAYMDFFLGYRYFLQFTNTSATVQTLSFDFTETQGGSLAAASPFGRSEDLDNDGYPDTPGGYAATYQTGGLIDYTDVNNPIFAAPANSFTTTAFIGSASYSVPSVIHASSVLKAGETRTYEFYSTSESYVVFNPAPVPEPTTMLALGAGALGFLRRRRKS